MIWLAASEMSGADACTAGWRPGLISAGGRSARRWRTRRGAWRPGVKVVRVNTCSLDHPAALPAYLAAGFRAVRRAFESFPDPRLTGLLPEDVAPQLPLVEHPRD